MLTLGRFSGLVRRLYDVEDAAAVPVAFADLATAAVRCANASYNRIVVDAGGVEVARSRGIRVPSVEEDPLRRHLVRHPMIARFAAVRGGVWKFSDFLTRAEYHRTDLYNEYYRRSDTQAQIACCVTWERGRFVMLALNHVGGEDFSEEDRTVIGLLQPHFERAQRIADRWAEAAAGWAAVTAVRPDPGVGVLLLARDLRPLHASPGAARLWSGGGSLPVEVREWLAEEARRAATEELAVRPPVPLRVERPEGVYRLEFRPGGERVLPVVLVRWMSRQAAGGGSGALTPREEEVLAWVAEGKTNAEIGVILGASKRTVDKHVERVLRKLGVETRAAALRLVLERRVGWGGQSSP